MRNSRSTIHDSRRSSRAALVAALVALGLVTLAAAAADDESAGEASETGTDGPERAQDAPTDEGRRDASSDSAVLTGGESGDGATRTEAEGDEPARAESYVERDRGAKLPEEDAPGVPAGGLGERRD